MTPTEAEGSTGEVRDTVVITRELDFPRASVLAMFTDPERAARWFGSPEGAVKELFEWDLRAGATFRIHDRMDDEVARTTWTVEELAVPGRIVLRSSTVPPGGSAPWEALQTVTLEELGPRRTLLTVHVRVLRPGSFPGGARPLLHGFEGGWGETLAVLRRELEGRPNGGADPSGRGGR